ncbi:MAG: Tol-Pal system beta propeller repeat protein TolB [Gammaproteobacteria bacterium]|nr:Tol-Pal system beta propeller repeat protein TolB [Gammaproteobacteria bacterium]
MKKLVILVGIFIFSWPLVAFEIFIDRGTDQVSKIAVVPFGTVAEVNDPSDVIEFDLERSGLFTALAEENMLSMPQTTDEVNFRDWNILGAKYLIIGSMEERSEIEVAVTYHVFDVELQRRLVGGVASGRKDLIRDIAHLIADQIFEAITNVKGAFSTKIMYVLVQGRGTEFPTYHLNIADSDGENIQTILQSNWPILSPAWAPDGQSVCYVSFESGRSQVIGHEILTGEREVLAAFEGNNSSPDFSPDGEQIALTLTRDGNPEVYTMNLADRTFRRITTHRGIDTEPTWTADGSSLIFTSDRSGNPQLYQVDLKTLSTNRLTFVGTYNARARTLPDRKHLLYVHRIRQNYHIVWASLDESSEPIVLTGSVMDESPSVAPNGSMVMYATKQGSRGILGIVSVDGQVELRLPSEDGDVQEPAWSPYLSTTLIKHRKI